MSIVENHIMSCGVITVTYDEFNPKSAISFRRSPEQFKKHCERFYLSKNGSLPQSKDVELQVIASTNNEPKNISDENRDLILANIERHLVFVMCDYLLSQVESMQRQYESDDFKTMRFLFGQVHIYVTQTWFSYRLPFPYAYGCITDIKQIWHELDLKLIGRLDVKQQLAETKNLITALQLDKGLMK